MGLDMYLNAEKYVSGYSHNNDDDKALYKQIITAVGVDKLVETNSPGVEIRATVAYWRKANAIHSWFVRELAKGVDECQRIYVSVDELKKLIAECQAALKLYKAGKVIESGKLMQPAEGFFFGSTEVNDYWADDLKYTIKQLTPLVNPEVSKKFDYYYRASW